MKCEGEVRSQIPRVEAVCTVTKVCTGSFCLGPVKVTEGSRVIRNKRDAIPQTPQLHRLPNLSPRYC